MGNGHEKSPGNFSKTSGITIQPEIDQEGIHLHYC